jgi:tetratricopeptide (TPR) repeat protein
MVDVPTEVRTLLRAAVNYLNGRDAAAAQHCLNRIARLDPDNSQAAYLSGVIQFDRREWRLAESLFRRAWALVPGQPQVAFHLSQTLRALRQPTQALSLASAVHESAPEHAGIWFELVKALEESGAPEEAAVKCRQLLAHHPGNITAAILLAQLLSKCGKRPEAEDVLREALTGTATEPTSSGQRVQLLSELAGVLKRSRRHREALECLDLAAAVATLAPEAQVERAAILQHLQRFDEAAAALRAALKGDPLNLNAHVQLNEILYRHQHDEEFLTSYDVAANLMVGAAELPAAKGQSLLKVGRAMEAYECYERALRIDPLSPDALVGRQRAIDAMGDRQAALSQLERNLKCHPRNGAILVEGAGLLLRSGDAKRARTLAASAHTIDPTDQTALAVLGLAYRQLNQPEESELNGYESLVQVFDLAPPRGFTQMDAFNEELASYLEALHGDQREYFTQTARHGTRLFDAAFDNGHDLIDRLKVRIDETVSRYIAALPENVSHPFTGRRTRAFLYTGSWSSTLKDRGFHLNHIHAAGWISSAYYVAVPKVATAIEERQGWLKFGEPSAEFGTSFAPRRMVQPAPGRLVLFPSYLWHGTTPFQSGQKRTTIAFDVIPAGPSQELRGSSTAGVAL